MDEANALLRDAQFDLDHTRITAPFSGRMGTHLVSVGNLISGSRAGSSPTTLLATIVSLDPIYLNFDISEADYMAFIRERGTQDNPPSDQVSIALSDELTFDRKGTLTFIDNALNRSSGTIQARATVQNPDLLMTPGGFARVRVGISSPEPVLLVPDASVLPDQSEHIVLTVDADNVITPKRVEVGDLRGGLRVIRTGIEATDKIVIEGIPTAIPGTKVSPQLSVIEFGLDQE
jgi:RND family efflux transporter MFP subunit